MAYLRRVPVVLMAGQSNTEGRGLVSDLPSTFLGPYRDAEIFDLLNTLDFQALEIGVNNQTLSANPAHHGPEVTLVPAIRNLLGEPVYLVKLAKDGSPLIPLPGGLNDWSPADLSQALLDTLDAAAAALELRGLLPDVRVWFSQQGETDCFAQGFAEAYYPELLEQYQFIRSEILSRGFTTWRDGLFPIIAGKIHTDFAGAPAPFIALVNASKEAVAAELPRVVLVETDDLPVISPDPIAPFINSIHFTSAGARALGLRWAEAFARVEPDEIFPAPVAITVPPTVSDMPTVEQEEPRYEIASSVLVPRGLAWTRERESNLQRLLAALARTWARTGVRAKELERELLPGSATELLFEWERALGIPGECGALAPSVVLRRAAAAAKLAFQGGQNEAFFRDLAEGLGFTIEIVTFDGTTCNDTCNDFLAGADWVFAWKVRAPKLTPFFFRTGASVVGERLSTTNNELLECYIRDAKPAQTFVFFTYDLDVPVETYVPWEFVEPEPAVLDFCAPIVTTKKTAPV